VYIAYNTFATQRDVITFFTNSGKGNQFLSDKIDYFGLVGLGKWFI